MLASACLKVGDRKLVADAMTMVKIYKTIAAIPVRKLEMKSD
jgi:hypothetical protein